MQAMKKMGSIGKLMEMIPGMGQLKIPKDALKVQEGKLKKWRFILDSCTKAELEDPDTYMNAQRIEVEIYGAADNQVTFYERGGYVETERIKRKGEEIVVMQKDLTESPMEEEQL